MNEDIHALSGAYALDALDAAEREQFGAHLRACPACRQEVDELREVLVDLADGTAAQPPASLRSATFRSIGDVRPLPPRTARGGPATGPVEAVGVEASTSGGGRWRRAGLLAVAAVVLLVVAGAVVTGARRGGDGGGPTVAQVLDASDAQQHDITFPDGARAMVVVSRSEDRSAFVPADLPPAPKGMAYQLWYDRPGDGMISAGMVTTGSGRVEPMVLDGDLADATAVGITMEPATGSAEPTSEPMAVVRLD